MADSFGQPEPEPPPMPPIVPRFCTRCGAVWEPAWTTCLACAPRENAVGAPLGRQSSPVSPIRSAIVLYFLILVTIVVPSVAAIIIGGTGNDAAGFKGELVATFLSAGVILAWCAGSWSLVQPSLARRPGPGWYFLAAGASLITFPMATVVVTALVRWLGVEEVHYLDLFIKAGWGWWPAVLLVCVEPAIIEELGFRGIILGSLRRVLSDREAIGVSAVLFMIIHLSVLSCPHLLLLGLVLAYLRIRTGSLYPGMVLHFSHNLLVLLAEAWEGHST